MAIRCCSTYLLTINTSVLGPEFLVDPMLPGRVAVSERAYIEAIDSSDGCQLHCFQCKLTLGSCVCHFRGFRYEISTTTPKSMSHHCFHGPGMQRTKYPDIPLYSGFPGPHAKTQSKSLPFRSSARKHISDVPPGDSTPFHPEKLDTFDDVVACTPLGKQLSGDPIDVQQKTREGYEASVKRLVSFHGGSTAAMAAAADDARSRRAEGIEAVDVGMVNKDSSYSQIPNMAMGGAWRGNWDGDIPAWAPKQYEQKGVKPAFVAKGGRDTMVSYSRDNRLCVPARETLANKGMQSIFTHSYTAMSGRADQPSYNMCRTDTTPMQTRCAERVISLNRGATLTQCF